jgi:hypothetical protein
VAEYFSFLTFTLFLGFALALGFALLLLSLTLIRQCEDSKESAHDGSTNQCKRPASRDTTASKRFG